MIMRFNFKYLKYFLCTFIFSINLYAQSNKEIIIEGNKNVDDEIIFSIINDKITDYSKENLNDIIKVLYSTGNFNSIEIEYKDDNIIFKIIENPSINSIKFIGNERFKKSEIFEIFNEDDFFSNFDLHPHDMKFSVTIPNGQIFDRMLNKTSSHMKKHLLTK